MKPNPNPAHQLEAEPSEQTPRRSLNWPFYFGILLVTIIAIMAFIGPDIAPKDPAEELNIVNIEGKWYIPPFDIGTPGYPLGSDRFGRDLYSRLLWGIRPTMIMVVLVAVVRLVIGVIIGLSAGWFSGKTARFLNSLIQTALALPVLLVALGAIALVGVELGIWAFIIGLSLTGWVDTALQVREQTRIVKGQIYVEAASAMGASNRQILSNHILKQISPMLLMLFAFEISSTLMLTAGLGFLGYYIGGDVWVETDDFVARRISGSPELGQMLATSWVTLTKPWAMVAVGTTVFITVLGFNLIGEGLRQSMGFANVPRKSAFYEIRQRFSFWFENDVWHPAIQFFRIRPLRIGLTGIAAFFLLSFGVVVLLDEAPKAQVSQVLRNFEVAATTEQESNQTSNPVDLEESLPSAEPVQTISYDPSIVWDFHDESGLAGSIALSNDGDKFYLASEAGNVYAINLDGEQIWQSELPNGAFGTPLVLDNRDIVVADKEGGLYRLSPEGEIIWQFQTEVGERSHSGATTGPDGTIYYTVGTASKGFVQAVSPEGVSLWVTEAETPFFFEAPQPSADGNYVYLKEDIFNSQSGELINLEFDLDVRRFFSGQDGKNYLLAGNKIINWQENNGAIDILDIAEWDSSIFGEFASPIFVDVTEDEVGWMLYTSPGGSTTVVWASMDDQLLGISNVRISGTNHISVSSDLTAYLCGGGTFNTESTDCAALSPDSEGPLWKYHLGDFGLVNGGIIIDDRLFFTTEDGYLFEIDQNYQESITMVESETFPGSSISSLEPGLVWSYQLPEDISFDYVGGPDGKVYLLTENGELLILDSDGQLIATQNVNIEPYRRISETGRNAPLEISPLIMPDGVLVIISDESIVNAFDSDGNLIWEVTLGNDPAEYPILDDNGKLYLIDEDAMLYVFSSEGLEWQYQSEVADVPAHGIAIGPEGNVYYVVTNYSKGFILALSPSGEELWVTQTTTRDFYDNLHISSDGEFVSLAENLFKTADGEIIEYGQGEKIDEYFFGGDGRKFVRSQHTVSEWQIGSEGVQILNSGTVGEGDTNLFPPLGSDADSNGIVWMYYQEKYSGGGIFVVWMTAEGELLGRKLVHWNRGRVNFMDYENSLLTECFSIPETHSLECSRYSPTSEEPIWRINIKDIPQFHQGSFYEDFLYLEGEENTLIKVFIGNPGS